MGKLPTRIEYEQSTLTKSQAAKNPFDQFSLWWQQALAHKVPMPDAMQLCTIDEQNHPDARIVLLKGFSEDGFVFYTNYNSKKAQQLLLNNTACLIFFWPLLERQIRIRGVVNKTSAKESEDYFKSRPRQAQSAAWASPQSQEVADRSELEKAFNAVEERFKDHDIPCPDFWGGFRLVPNFFEFWQGRLHRLHDRLAYERHQDQWRLVRLAP